jgi:DNA end-binding protein Ku
MMRYADEIVDSAGVDVPDAKPATPRELELALDLVKALSGPFDPTKHPDQYRAAVEAAVGEKTASSSLTKAPAVDAKGDVGVTKDGKVIDLAELLARSLKKAEPEAKEGETAAVEKKPGPKKAGGKEAKKRAAG